tara:strand:+ start:127 stop:1329 length:1203 start_codon:yes stop_codon:yes gene_type:complete
MTNKNLLKEAIADAKAVKETAIANAKLALEEAFTPHLKSMLSAKLQEMDEDEEVKEEVELDEMDAPSFARKNSPAGDSLKDVAPTKVGKSTVQEDEVDEEINLDELLKELAEDARTDAEEEGYLDGEKDENKKLQKEDEKTDAEEEGYKDGEEDEKEDMEDGMEDEEIDLEDMSEDDLKSFIEDVISDMVSAGEIEPGEEFVEDEVEVEDVEDVEVEDDVDVDIEIDEAKKEEVDEAKKEEVDEAKKEEVDEAKKEEVDEMSDPVMRHGDKGDSEVEKETEKMRFKEVMSEIEALKSELQEVNLLNAKLLYTNKIFKEKNLAESKKVKVLKAFDKAETVRDAKSIFETLNEGILDTPTINKPFKRGSASQATGLEPKAEKQPIIESNDVYNRMRKLAGLI